VNNWKQDLSAKWNNLGVEKFLKNINIDFESNFVNSLENYAGENLYKNHIWEIIPHSLISNGVLHAYPSTTSDENIVWEEWFFYENSIRHHVLSQKELAKSDGTWSGSFDDKDHPNQVLGKTWFYYNDTDLSPFYLR